MENRFHRLPDGASTDDDDLYVSKWRETFAAIEEATGWQCYGFDPGCSLSTGEHSTVSLRLHECQKLNDICKELLELRRAK
jgi:hypothetical protein